MPEAIIVKKKAEAKPWTDVCSKKCWFAKHDRCRCKCKKRNHGKGLQKRLDDKQEEEKQ